MQDPSSVLVLPGLYMCPKENPIFSEQMMIYLWLQNVSIASKDMVVEEHKARKNTIPSLLS